jgi:hypothetical protein
LASVGGFGNYYSYINETTIHINPKTRKQFDLPTMPIIGLMLI